MSGEHDSGKAQRKGGVSRRCAELAASTSNGLGGWEGDGKRRDSCDDGGGNSGALGCFMTTPKAMNNHPLGASKFEISQMKH